MGDTSSSSASEYRGLGVVLELDGSSSRVAIEDMDQGKEGRKESVKVGLCCLFCKKGWLYKFFIACYEIKYRKEKSQCI